MLLVCVSMPVYCSLPERPKLPVDQKDILWRPEHEQLPVRVRPGRAMIAQSQRIRAEVPPLHQTKLVSEEAQTLIDHVLCACC